MINLLPTDIKESYQYARRNAALVRWLAALGLAIVGLAAISAGGLWYLDQTTGQYSQQVSIAQDALRQQNQGQVQRKVKDISDSMNLAVQVLSKEVLFSKLLKRLAVVTPSNATLSTISISQVQGAVDINAKTTDYNAATQLQVNLADPANQIFSKADIINISCGKGSADSTSGVTPSPASAATSRYPCDVTIRALFTDNNPFLFINDAKPAAAAKKATP